jgi:hypothetical protein
MTAEKMTKDEHDAIGKKKVLEHMFRLVAEDAQFE